MRNVQVVRADPSSLQSPQGVPIALQESLLLYVLVSCGGPHIMPAKGTAARPMLDLLQQ
jgi:hypothetical protein